MVTASQVVVLARNTVDRQPGTPHQPVQYMGRIGDKSTNVRTFTEMRADDCCQDSQDLTRVTVTRTIS